MTKTTPTAAERAIARRVSKGANPAEAAALLSELTAAHSEHTLPAALVYWDFATATTCDRIAAALLELEAAR